METEFGRVPMPTWRVRRVTADLGSGRELTACADGSWALSNDAAGHLRHGREARGGIAAAKRAATVEARRMGWL